MVRFKNCICPRCGGILKYYDNVKRIVRTKNQVTKWIKMRRLRCVNCHSVHRELPDFMFPFKQYESEIIIGVIEELIDADTLGFENYPCERTMARWITQKMQLLLWKNL